MMDMYWPPYMSGDRVKGNERSTSEFRGKTAVCVSDFDETLHGHRSVEIQMDDTGEWHKLRTCELDLVLAGLKNPQLQDRERIIFEATPNKSKLPLHPLYSEGSLATIPEKPETVNTQTGEKIEDGSSTQIDFGGKNGNGPE